MKNSLMKNNLLLSSILILSACDNNSDKPIINPSPPPPMEQKKEAINIQSENSISIDQLEKMVKNNNFEKQKIEDKDSEVKQNFLVTNDPVLTLNQLRNTLGIQTLTNNQQLNTASEYHAKYMIETNNIAHEESNTSNYFFGITPMDRVQKTNYNMGKSFVAGEVLTFTQGNIDEGLDKLIRAIYHRFILLDPVYSEVGIATEKKSENSVLEMVLASKGDTYKFAPVKIAIYPYSQQADVPYVFNANEEIPNPMPSGYDRVGFPVSIQATSGYKLNTQIFELYEKSTNQKVDTKLLTTDTDSHVSASQAAIIPWKILKSGTIYTVKYKGDLQGQALNYQWDFTTGSQAGINVQINGEAFKPGMFVNIKYTAPDSSKVNTSTSITSTDKNLLQIESETWGNLTYKILPGCLAIEGCNVIMNFKNEDGLTKIVSFKIYP